MNTYEVIWYHNDTILANQTLNADNWIDAYSQVCMLYSNHTKISIEQTT